MEIGTILKHYKRKEIQEEMINAAKDREVAVRFGEKGFGKRPDLLMYPNEILNLAKQNATSFHVSEEHWHNPLALKPELGKTELERLRKGWDLVIDVDCRFWEYSKLITHLLILELKKHGVKSISVKFSGSKGFHIGVPFSAFPAQVHGKDIILLFPEGLRRVAVYLKDIIEPVVLDRILREKSRKELAEMVGKDEKELIKTFCTKCNAEQKPFEAKTYFICPRCHKKLDEKDKENEAYMLCPECKTIMEKIEAGKKTMRCYKCNHNKCEERFDISLILNIDTVLISSRHMYRMPYSLHEKSGLCSLPLNPEKVLEFEKEMADPAKVTVSGFRFLDDSKTESGEAARLIVEAFDYNPKLEVDKITLEKEYDVPTEAIPIDLFPPCIIKGLNGMDDGKKRFMFALLNFLECCGYNNDAIEKIITEWNARNPDPLRDVIVNGQLRYRKVQKRERVLPQNCRGYYQDLQLCSPDGICSKIKNPVQYAKIKVFILDKEKEKGQRRTRLKLTDEQKEMRRKHREKMKSVVKETNN